MPSEPTLYLLESDDAQCRRLQTAGRSVGCHVTVIKDIIGVVDKMRGASPDVIVVGAHLSHVEAIGLCRQIRADASLQESYILLSGDCEVPRALTDLVDDLLRRDAPEYEVAIRLQAGIRQSYSRRLVHALSEEMERLRGEQERVGDYMTETTTQLVEIAAQLQSEVVHSVEREEESVRAAQLDTIAQAAAALRHEINNPLFAIVGSAESALKRLGGFQSGVQSDLTPVRTNLERILRGADRIQQAIQAISEMLTPVTTDYVEGVSMLNLSKTSVPPSPPS